MCVQEINLNQNLLIHHMSCNNHDRYHYTNQLYEAIIVAKNITKLFLFFRKRLNNTVFCFYTYSSIPYQLLI